MTSVSTASKRTGRRTAPADQPPRPAPGEILPGGRARAAFARLVRAAALGAASAALLGGCAMFGGDRDDEIPDLAPFEPLAAVEAAWSTDAGSGIGRDWLVLAPAVANGRIFVADARGRVSAWDAASGRSVWRTDTDADITGGVGADDGLVLVGTGDGEVIALDQATGGITWRAQLTSEVLSRPRLTSDRVVVRTLDGKLYGLDAASGEVRWVHDGGVPALTVRGTSAPVIESGMAIIGFDNGRVAAVRSATGELVWEGLVVDPRGRSELERLADVDTDPVVAGGVVHAASYERAVAAFDAETGRRLWRRDIPSRSGLATDTDLVFVADTDGSVQALDRISGAGVWTQASLAGRAPAWPVVHGAYVAVVDIEGYIHWLRRADGRLAARTRSGEGRPAGPPTRHGDALVAYWGKGRITTLKVR